MDRFVKACFFEVEKLGCLTTRLVKDNDDSELSSGWIKGGELVERII